MGASDCIIHTPEFYIEITSNFISKITLHNDIKADVLHVEMVKLIKDIVINNVLYALSFNFNLILTKRLT